MAPTRKDGKDPFGALRVGRKLRLADVDPAAKPYSGRSREADEARLAELALEIDRQQDLLYANSASPGGPSLLLVLQGMDTSGKDGTARAVFRQCSPLGVRVAAFEAPTDLERAHDFLWRVHQQVPRAGEIVVFNRSHYEDVLVPLVEGWIDKRERDRRLAHIVAFERLLVESGCAVLKCFLHISRDEQKKRLQARLDEPDKNWKFNPGDLAVRAQWPHYQAAYEAALVGTSTADAPWFVVPADSKSHRNLMIAGLVERALAGMQLRAPKPDYDPKAVKII